MSSDSYVTRSASPRGCEGFVQGVGFRWWTRSKALELGLVGSARNLTDGRVAVVAEGDRAACEALLAALRGGHAPGAVRQVVEQWTTRRVISAVSCG